MQRKARAVGANIAWFPVDTGPVAQVRNINTVLTLHGVAALHEPDVRGPLSGRIWRKRARAAAIAADVIITVSHSSADDIVQLAGERIADRIVVIPHGIADEWFEPARHDALADIKRTYPLEEPYALYYGNIEPRKNLPMAVGAIERLREVFPNLRLVVSGAPAWDSDDLMELLSVKPWVDYLGRRSDDEIRALLAGARCFVFPSRYEGFGFPVLEAMAAGTPVACSRRGSLQEIVADAAFTTDDLTVEGFVEACERALTADRSSTAKKSIEHARRFSWATSIRKHQEVFESIS